MLDVTLLRNSEFELRDWHVSKEKFLSYIRHTYSISRYQYQMFRKTRFRDRKIGIIDTLVLPPNLSLFMLIVLYNKNFRDLKNIEAHAYNVQLL